LSAQQSRVNNKQKVNNLKKKVINKDKKIVDLLKILQKSLGDHPDILGKIAKDVSHSIKENKVMVALKESEVKIVEESAAPETTLLGKRSFAETLNTKETVNNCYSTAGMQNTMESPSHEQVITLQSTNSNYCCH